MEDVIVRTVRLVGFQNTVIITYLCVVQWFVNNIVVVLQLTFLAFMYEIL